MPKSIEDYIKELRDFYSRRTPSLQQEQETVVINEPTATPDMQEKYGNINISVTHSRGTFPVENARVTVYDRNGDTVAERITDNSGKTGDIVLTTPAKELSETPGESAMTTAFYYNVSAIADNYVETIIENIPVYEGVTTLQSMDLPYLSTWEQEIPWRIVLPINDNL